MFQLALCGSCRGDATAPYKVILDKEYAVSEFMKTVCERVYEWGYIGIKSENSFFGDPFCEYGYGKLFGTLPGFMDKKVKSAKADGGWSRMDYILEVE